MFTACPGNFGTQNIHGGFTYGKRPLPPPGPAQKQMKFKGEPSGDRLKQPTVNTEYMTGTRPVKRNVGENASRDIHIVFELGIGHTLLLVAPPAPSLGHWEVPGGPAARRGTLPSASPDR